MATEALTTELNALITQHLPAQVGAALQARLRQADRDAALVITQMERITKLEADVKHANSLVRKQEEFDAAVAKLATDRELLTESQRELRHQLQIADIKEKAALQGKTDVIDLVSQIFRTPAFKRVLSQDSRESLPVVVPGQTYPTQHERSSRTSTTEEVTPLGG